MEFVGVQGETLIKNPGSINGESFSLRDLTDCSVYLLDYASEVDVTNCINCQIFIGPVDGPAILSACHNCNIQVACQQFQAKNCTSLTLGLYTATVPSLHGCTDINVSCWSGAYPGLSAHFDAAKLDPTKNQWSKVYDASATAPGQPPNFTLAEGGAEPWEVSVEGVEGVSENPVPAPPSASAPASVPAPAPAGVVLEEALFVEEQPAQAVPTENGGNPFNTGGDPGTTTGTPANTAYDVEPPATAQARDKLKERLADQSCEETEKRAEAKAAAARYLEEFYERRTAQRDARIAAGRDELAKRGSQEVGPQGESLWEKAISMVDFNAARPGGTDLSRFKGVLFSAKERGTVGLKTK